jgi:hypothetical protein
MTRAWDYSKASGNELLVLLALADIADDNGECWPSIAHLAKKCRVSSRTVQRSIRALEELGEVVVILGGGKASTAGGTRSNRYRIIVHMPVENEGDILTGSDAGDGGGVTRVPGGGVSPVSPEPSLRTVIEPPLNPQEIPGDRNPLRRGMRGTGTSPREIRQQNDVILHANAREAELDRLVKAIPDKYAECSEDIVLEKIELALPGDPERRERSLAHYRRLRSEAA